MHLAERWIARFYNFLGQRNDIAKGIIVPASTKIEGSKIFSHVNLAENTKIINCNLVGKIDLCSKNWLSNCNISGNVSVGESCRLYYCQIEGSVSIGRYSSIWGPNSDIISSELFPIRIGSFCSIARNVSMQTFNHNTKKTTTYFIGQNFFKEKWENERISKGEIIIENDVWIGAHSVILGGVKISNGAVIAANSVVTKNVEPYAIVAGNPAITIDYRFDSEIIDKLLKMQWWNWDDQLIKENKVFFENEITNDILETFLKND